MALFDSALLWRSLPYIVRGVPLTLSMAALSMALGLFLGVFPALGRMSRRRWLRAPAVLFISFMRGTPALVWLFVVYFGLPGVGITINAFPAAVLALGINSSAFIAEVYRGAVTSIPAEQWEVAAGLGLRGGQVYRFVVVPQAIRVALPSLSNVMLDLVKATSLASVITVEETLLRAKIVAGRTFDAMTMYLAAALLYWVVCAALEWGQQALERQVDFTRA